MWYTMDAPKNIFFTLKLSRFSSTPLSHFQLSPVPPFLFPTLHFLRWHIDEPTPNLRQIVTTTFPSLREPSPAIPIFNTLVHTALSHWTIAASSMARATAASLWFCLWEGWKRSRQRCHTLQSTMRERRHWGCRRSNLKRIIAREPMTMVEPCETRWPRCCETWCIFFYGASDGEKVRWWFAATVVVVKTMRWWRWLVASGGRRNGYG